MAIEIVMPRLNWSQETGIVTRWLRAPGEYVKVGEPLMMVETEKAEVEVESDNNGFLHPVVSEHETLAVGAVIGYLLSENEAPPVVLPADDVVEASPSSDKPAASDGEARSSGVAATPLARRVSKELGVDLSDIQGSGRDGSITERDVRAYVERQEVAPREEGADKGAVFVNPSQAVAAPADLSAGPTEAVPLNSIRRATAQRLTESFATIPHFYLRVDVDMTEVERRRKSVDPPPSLTAVILRAVAVTLKSYPEVNCSYSNGDVIRKANVNIGVAVSTPQGLLVPVIHDANELTLGQVDQRIRELRERSEERRFKANELSGGTFTISNLGMFGVDGFSAVINPPEAAILAVGSLRDLACRGKDGVEFRPSVELTLSIDHRALDGSDGARFLAELKGLLVHPSRLF